MHNTHSTSQRELKHSPAQTQHQLSSPPYARIGKKATRQEQGLWVSRSAAHLEQLQAVYFSFGRPHWSGDAQAFPFSSLPRGQTDYPHAVTVQPSLISFNPAPLVICGLVFFEGVLFF